MTQVNSQDTVAQVGFHVTDDILCASGKLNFYCKNLKLEKKINLKFKTWSNHIGSSDMINELYNYTKQTTLLDCDVAQCYSWFTKIKLEFAQSQCISFQLYI